MWILCTVNPLYKGYDPKDCFDWTKNDFLHENHQWIIWNSFTVPFCAVWILWHFDSVGTIYCRVPYFLLWDEVFFDIEEMSAMDNNHGTPSIYIISSPFPQPLTVISFNRSWQSDLTFTAASEIQGSNCCLLMFLHSKEWISSTSAWDLSYMGCKCFPEASYLTLKPLSLAFHGSSL